ncbi:MAG TPA: sn-glycerol-3-phosphate ABC transporter substrate-binding protein UgpB, partial [Candidatus Methylomirabilis sp.]|nr:sn-glycerol-3-phosphate ABC transporter substrate-binding protein UgpB [Candidatus Methylomirabilis sp.]
MRASRRTLIGLVAGLTLLGAWAAAPAEAQQRVQVEFWHGLSQPLGGILEKVVADFNASQNKYQVNATFKGQYPETMMAAIAAFRSGNAPHIVQMFEVGTATMMAAGRAIKPVYELAKETGVNIDPKNYVGGVRAYYSTPDGKLVSMPFNSSTPVTWYNKDAFKKAGLDPEKPPRTWEETFAAARKIVAAKAAPCGYTMAWPTWTQYENFSAIHNVPLATKANGMKDMDAELKINSPLHVKHLQALMDLQKEGVFKYGGRDGAADALFPSGECAIFHGSSGMRARVIREAKFQWGETFLPYYKGTPGAPKNSIIGGASFWVMASPKRTSEDYKAVAEFFNYISRPEVDAKWHMDTGYVPITLGGFALASGQGYYIKNPGADIPFRQLTLTEPTENSMGLRLGNMPEIRVVIQ